MASRNPFNTLATSFEKLGPQMRNLANWFDQQGGISTNTATAGDKPGRGGGARGKAKRARGGGGRTKGKDTTIAAAAE